MMKKMPYDYLGSGKGTDLFFWLVPLNQNLPLAQKANGVESGGLFGAAG